MKYKMNIITNMHDADNSKVIRPTGLLRYFHTSSNAQLEEMFNITETSLRNDNLAFILNTFSVDIFKPLYMEENIEVETYAINASGFKYPRDFNIYRDGELIIKSRATYALVNIETRAFVRTTDFPCNFGWEDEDVDTNIGSRIKPIKEEFDYSYEMEVPYSFIDRNNHMNNTWYADVLLSAIPNFEAEKLEGFTISYLKEAKRGDKLTLKTYFDGEKWYVKSLFNDGQINALLVAKIKGE